MSIETRLKFEKVCKWTAIIFMVLTMVNVFMPDLFVVSIEQEELTLDNRPQAFVRWFNAVAFLVIPIIAFFNKPTFKKIAVYFCLPMAIIYLCFFKEIMGCESRKIPDFAYFYSILHKIYLQSSLNFSVMQI